MQHVQNLVVGCGLSGAVIAEQLAAKGEQVLIIDQRDHVGGNCHDYRDGNGITIHTYGPHVFHTSNKQVWDYLSRFTDWHPFMYRVKAVIDGMEIPVPFNLHSLAAVFPATLAGRLEEKLLASFSYNAKVSILELKKHQDPDLQFLADYIYTKVFLGYTVKQWGVRPEDLDPSVSGRVPVFVSRDDRYFQDTYQAIPKEGYSNMIRNIVNHKRITLQLNTPFQSVKDKLSFARLFYTGPIDEFFGYSYGKLPYRSLRFDLVQFDRPYYQSGPQINYPENYDFTRSVEYKYYLNEKSARTVVSFEYPLAFQEEKNERYYPVPNDENSRLYNKYREKARTTHQNVYFAGRLGRYQYYNMDEAVLHALSMPHI